MKQFLGLLLVFWLLMPLSTACGSSPTPVPTLRPTIVPTPVDASLVKKQANFNKAVGQYEAARLESATGLDTAINVATTELGHQSAKVSDLRGIAARWEAEWKFVEIKANSLEERFATVADTSVEYFDELDRFAMNIREEEARLLELAENRKLREKWLISFERANLGLDQLREILIKGDDFHVRLRLKSTRDKVMVNILELQAISEDVQVLMGDLRQLTEAGKNLLVANQL